MPGRVGLQMANGKECKEGAGVRYQTRNAELEQRMLSIASDGIRLMRTKQTIPQSVREQLIRSLTSVGANYAEACNAVSKQDFRNKIHIAKKEAAESRYWLDLCISIDDPETWVEIRREVHELVLILQSIANRVRP